MGKELQDGISMDHSFLIIDEKKTGFQITGRMIQLLAILIGSWSTVSVIIDSMSVPVNLLQVAVAVFICSSLLFVLFLIRSFDLVKLFFIILFYILFFFSRLPKITNGFYILENGVIDRLVTCYNYSGYYFTAHYTTKTADTTMLIMMLMIPVITLLTIAVVRNRFVNFCSLVLFFPVAGSFLMGVIPSERNLITYLIAVIYLTRSGLPYRHRSDRKQLTLLHRINSRAAVWMSLIALFVFFIIKLFFPVDKYENIKELDDMKVKVQKTVMDISVEDISNKIAHSKLFRFKSATGGLLGGELGEEGKVTYTGSEQLLVKAPVTSATRGFYLKGYVGSTYNGNRWDGPAKEDRKSYDKLLDSMPVDQFTPVNQTSNLLSSLLDNTSTNKNKLSAGGTATIRSFALLSLMRNQQYQIEQSTMQVQYKEANKKYIYAPYFTKYNLLKQIYYERDLYAAPLVKQDSYVFHYYYNISLLDSAFTLFKGSENDLYDYAGYEDMYRDYVYRVYTAIPEEGLDRLKNEFSEKNLPYGVNDITTKLEYVKSYLNQNTVYTLSPGKLPKDKDFVEYFLYENKKGYCAHYASAATLMLRAMGIPARYVEGYAVGPQTISEIPAASQSETVYSDSGIKHLDTPSVDITVTDKNAHAWVEVYIDGCGWIPVEFTPGASINFDTTVISNLSKTKDLLGDGNANKLSSDTDVKPKTAEKKKEEDTSKDKERNTSGKNLINLAQLSKYNDIFMISFFLLSIVAFMVFLIIKKRKRRRIRKTRDNNKRVLLLFAEVEKVLSVCKNGLPGRGARLEDCEDFVKNRSPYIDSKLFTHCMEIIKKARFGNEGITQRELMEVENFYRKLYKDAYAELPSYKRMYLKFILLM